MKQHIGVLLVSLMLVGCAEKTAQGRIVFQSNRDGNFDIYSMKADGTDVKRLTNSSAYDISPSWSPDGSHIVFASDRDGNWDIYVMRSNGTEVRRLTSPPGSNTSPSWVRETSKIVFVSTRDALNGEIYLMESNGSNVERLTRDSTVKDYPVMTPDGASIVYTATGSQGTSIAVMKRVDRTVSILTRPSDNAADARVSRDGLLMVFAASLGGHSGLYTMSVAGKNMTLLTQCEDLCRTPAWGASAHEVIYSRREGLYRLSSGTHEEMRLSTSGDSFPDWTED